MKYYSVAEIEIHHQSWIPAYVEGTLLDSLSRAVADTWPAHPRLKNSKANERSLRSS